MQSEQASKQAFLRNRILKWQTMRDGIAFPAWVGLGLIGVSVCVPLLEFFADLYGRYRISVLPGISAIVFYILLVYVQPRLFPWPRRRIPYLAIMFALSFALTYWEPITMRFLSAISVYGIAAHARVAFGKRESWLVEGTIAAAVLLGMLLSGGIAQDVLLRHEVSKFGISISVGEASILVLYGAWLLGLLFVYAFTALGINERNERLRSEKLVTELTETQEQLRAYALRAEELATMRERTRVAREVHDTLAQGLAAIKMHLETGCAVFSEQPDLALQHMERARTLAGTHLSETRSTILELRSEALDNRPLSKALAALTAAWPTSNGNDLARGQRQATFHVSGIAENARFTPAIELACYRIAQEALSNAARHSHANHVDVELSVEANELCLTVTDDGIGFDPEAMPPSTGTGGFGIIGMSERMRLLNGHLEVISALQAGTQVVAMIPLATSGTSGAPGASNETADMEKLAQRR